MANKDNRDLQRYFTRLGLNFGILARASPRGVIHKLIKTRLNTINLKEKNKPIPMTPIQDRMRTRMVFLFFPFLPLLLSAPLFAQQVDCRVQFEPRLHGKHVPIGDFNGAGIGSDSLHITSLRFYISEFMIMQDGYAAVNVTKRAHLVDALDPEKTTLKLGFPSLSGASSLCFTLGLDSTMNTSGISRGDLDPVEGMYWTWQSGFIHFKIEGKCNLPAAGETAFEYHLGGYRTPYATSARLCFRTEKPRREWKIAFDLDRFLDVELLTESPKLMSPGPEALRLFTKAKNAFQLIDTP